MMSSFHSSNIKKKMAIEEAVGSKPKRPLSVYNYFFQEERKKLLLTLPIRSQGKPRHSHGKCDFATMAKIIAYKWNNKEVDPQDLICFEQQAKAEKLRYKRDMEIYKTKLSAYSMLQKNEIADINTVMEGGVGVSTCVGRNPNSLTTSTEGSTLTWQHSGVSDVSFTHRDANLRMLTNLCDSFTTSAPLEVVYNTSDCGNSLLSSCFGSLSPTSIFASCPAADAPAAPAAAHQRAHQNHNQIIATNPDHQSERNTRATCYANPMMDQLTDNLGEEGVLLFTELFRNIPTSS